jgi:hypothetical protein
MNKPSSHIIIDVSIAYQKRELSKLLQPWRYNKFRGGSKATFTFSENSMYYLP